ncbi:MAG: hypothetical protein WD557_19665 [Dehalococcoidia bacterium]
MTAALMPGAAVFASGSSTNCVGYEPSLLEAEVESSGLVLVARAEEVGALTARLRPEGFLKGPAQSRLIELQRGPGDGECPWARFSEGDRYLIFLRESDGGGFQWPIEARAFLLLDGTASLTAGQPFTTGEDELINEIRGFTEQYAVPAANESEGEGIEWGTTVLPIAVALGIVFVIGLFLMRIWHRIDPS